MLDAKNYFKRKGLDKKVSIEEIGLIIRDKI